MSVARILVLVAAGVAAVFVWLYVRNSSANVPAPTVAAAPAATAVRVLVAGGELKIGSRIGPSDLVWRDWPDGGISPQFITDRDNPDAAETYADAIVRDTIAAGEPIVARKIVLAGDASFMAAILDPGTRAVSTEITAETAAGGFILPGDRVDVIVTYEIESNGGGSVSTSRTVLQDVRVLAIDQQPARSEDAQVQVGSTATLELMPQEAEKLALGQAMGDVTLALRSLADAGANNAGEDARRAFGGVSDTLTIYRYGARQDAMLGGSP